MNRTSMSVGKKLGICFATSLTFALVSTSVSVWTTQDLSRVIGTDVRTSSQRANWSSEIAIHMGTMRSELRGMLLAARDKFQIGADPTGQFERSIANFDGAVAAVERVCQQYEGGAGAGDRTAIGQLREGLQQWSELFQQTVHMCRQGKPDEARNFSADRVRPIMEKVQRAAGRLSDNQQRTFEAQVRRASTLAARAIPLFAVFGAAMIAAAVVGMAVSLRITRKLRALTGRVASGSEQLNAAAGQIASASQSLAQTSTEQAASLEETSASGQQISAMSRQNRQHSEDAARMVAASTAKLAAATTMLDKMAVSMADTVQSSQKVSGIIKVIDEIAFQTNLLALNAAVEAARAGEAGMGFAVVADEVRNLAHRCAVAAKETATLIEQSVESSNRGRSDADQVAQAVRAIVEESGQLKTLVENVAGGSGEQASGIEQIARAIAHLEQATQQVAANAEESAAAAEELSSQSQSLQSIVDELAEMTGTARERKS